MSETLQKTAWNARGSSARGASHFRTGLPNQDSIGIWSDESRNRAIVVVSDGHGSARHFRSATGSKLATEAARSVLDTVALPVQSEEARVLGRRIVEAWREAVKAHLAEHPWETPDWEHVPAGEKEQVEAAIAENPLVAYGATLLAVLAVEGELFFLQLGDGDILCVSDDGVTARPMKEDARLIANQTTSLCQNEAPDNLRFAEIHGADGPLPALILLSSDGYSNSFHTDEDFVQVGSDYLGLLRQYGAEKVEAQLSHILSEASRQGSGDDITLGMLERATGVGPARIATPTQNNSVAPAETKSASQAQPVAVVQSKAEVLHWDPDRSSRSFPAWRWALAAIVVVAAASALAWWRSPQIAAWFHKMKHQTSAHWSVALQLAGGELPAARARILLVIAE